MHARAPQTPRVGAGPNRRFGTFRAVMALILREMATRYGRSPGGYAWAVLEPLGGIIVLGFGLSLLIRTPPVGSSFLLFFATAFLPFTMYQQMANDIGRCINFSRALLFYPAVTWVDAVLARFILTVLTHVVVMSILFTGLLIVSDTRALLDLGTIVEAVALTALFGLGVGVLNCVLFGLFDVWMQIWSIATRPLFFVSGVFFLYEDMPPLIQDILWFNPLLHITGLMRRGFYGNYDAAYVSISFVAGVSLVCLFLGVVLLGRYHRMILNR
ncbi:ABC transporter permease [Roseovarius aquimarinus]|uniref:Transport permease protein n=1 Tax=Roseovarius aquimarinus TaxID=1229156 RepID=A0ABW7IAE8_9RHOB